MCLVPWQREANSNGAVTSDLQLLSPDCTSPTFPPVQSLQSCPLLFWSREKKLPIVLPLNVLRGDMQKHLTTDLGYILPKRYNGVFNSCWFIALSRSLMKQCMQNFLAPCLAQSKHPEYVNHLCPKLTLHIPNAQHISWYLAMT